MLGPKYVARGRKTWGECIKDDIKLLGLQPEWVIFGDIWEGLDMRDKRLTSSLAWKKGTFSKYMTMMIMMMIILCPKVTIFNIKTRVSEDHQLTLVLNVVPKFCWTLSLPLTRIWVNFSTIYNDTLVAKGLKNDNVFIIQAAQSGSLVNNVTAISGGMILLNCTLPNHVGPVLWLRPGDSSPVSRNYEVLSPLNKLARVLGDPTKGEYHLLLRYTQHPLDAGTMDVHQWWRIRQSQPSSTCTTGSQGISHLIYMFTVTFKFNTHPINCYVHFSKQAPVTAPT